MKRTESGYETAAVTDAFLRMREVNQDLTFQEWLTSPVYADQRNQNQSNPRRGATAQRAKGKSMTREQARLIFERHNIADEINFGEELLMRDNPELLEAYFPLHLLAYGIDEDCQTENTK